MTAPETPPPGGTARLTPVTLTGEAGPIEALLQERDEHDHTLVAVVCHPHPLYGGTMHNKVAHRVASTLQLPPDGRVPVDGAYETRLS